jgi:hypothetical protein
MGTKGLQYIGRDSKLKEGMLIGSQIRTILHDYSIELKFKHNKLDTWKSFKPHHFMRNLQNMVQEVMLICKQFRC